MTPVLGPAGRGVVVATADPDAAVRDRAALELAGLEAATAQDLGPRVGPTTPVEEAPDAMASFWARALRRPALARGPGAYVVAGPDGSVVPEVPEEEVPARVAGSGPPPRRVAVFGGAWLGESEEEYDSARRLGEAVARAGGDVVTGGYRGVMAAASRGANHRGGIVVGATITSFSAQVPVNEWLTHEVETGDLFARLPVICDADAWVAFAGGVGTLAEVALCWNLVQTGSAPPRPLVVVGERWARALEVLRTLVIVKDPAHLDLVRGVAEVDDAFPMVVT